MSAEEELKTPVEGWRLATIEDFAAVDFEAPIRGTHFADPHDLDASYEQAFAEARVAGDETAQVVYRFLGHLCSMVLRPSDSATVWHPLFSLTDGARSTVAEDYRGEQTAILRALAPRIETIALRARAYDVAWSNLPSDGESAAAAISAYCDIVDGVLEGALTSRFGLPAGMLAQVPMHRALQIARLTTRRKTALPQKAIDTFTRYYAVAKGLLEIGVFVRLAQLALEFDLKDRLLLASELEASATAVPLGTYPMAVKGAFDLAAALYQKGDPVARQRCLLGAVRQTLSMRSQVSTPGAEAHWVMSALQQLQHIQGQEALKQSLEADLRRLQKASMNQMAEFEIDLQIGDAPDRVTAHFEHLTLPEALKAFAFLDRSRNPEQLKKEAVEAAKAAPLMASMPMHFVDADGRTVKIAPGLPNEGEPDPLWFTFMIDRAEGLRRQHSIGALIDPARLAIQSRFGLMQGDFAAILAASTFVPEQQSQVMALGFARLFQGDFVSAAYLLIPQVEPCLRHILKLNGNDPSKRATDTSEQDLSLANIYSRFRGELERILTPALALEIDRLFNTKPGPALRHEIAHGQMSAGDCYHPNAYYGSWLLYRTCCLFALPSWDGVVVPALQGGVGV